jgi:hypothetical protein
MKGYLPLLAVLRRNASKAEWIKWPSGLKRCCTRSRLMADLVDSSARTTLWKLAWIALLMSLKAHADGAV